MYLHGYIIYSLYKSILSEAYSKWEHRFPSALHFFLIPLARYSNRRLFNSYSQGRHQIALHNIAVNEFCDFPFLSISPHTTAIIYFEYHCRKLDAFWFSVCSIYSGDLFQSKGFRRSYTKQGDLHFSKQSHLKPLIRVVLNSLKF